jgi:PAS domain S-box-containing protein
VTANDARFVAASRGEIPAPGRDSLDGGYADLFDSALVGLYISRPDGTLVTCNEAFARILGFASVEEACATPLERVHASPEIRRHIVDLLRTQRRIDRVRAPLTRRDGRVIQVFSSVMGMFDASGSLAGLKGFIIDVTDTAEEERRLRQREERFRSIFLDAADAMLILDDDRRISETNRAAWELFQTPSERLEGRLLDELVIGDVGEIATAWTELLSIGEAKREHRVVSEGRAPRLVECSYRAAVHGRRHLCIARDVTERRLLEERLARSERIESVGRLAGGIAHDFNNLLTAILGYTELLLSHRGLEDADRADLEEIQKAGQRAAALTQQLLAYSRKQVLVPRDVDLNRTVENLQGMLARLIREDIVLSCELAADPALVRIDPTQIEQAILNLVLNARDALPGGGLIRLEVARVGAEDVEVPADHLLPAREWVRLRVIDNGMGIGPDVRAHLFEPFFTTKEVGKGTGLGLATVYGIVRQSNGFIGVESEPGKGSTFAMYFPAVRAVTVAAEVRQAREPVTGGQGETILLVEDEDAVRAIAGEALWRHGYHVLEASSARRAIEMFEQHANEVDLLLTDVVMPEMNGPALAQRLVGARPGLRILFMSGYADVGVPLAGNPNVSYLSKPFQASALAAKVGEVLSRPRDHASA